MWSQQQQNPGSGFKAPLTGDRGKQKAENRAAKPILTDFVLGMLCCIRIATNCKNTMMKKIA